MVCPSNSNTIAILSAESTLSSTTNIFRLTNAGGTAGALTLNATAVGASTTGNVTTNSLPLPSPALLALTIPPCDSTNRRTKLSPTPRPPCDRSASRCAWVKSSNTRGNSSGEMPVPLSRTCIFTTSSSSSARISINPLSWVYLAALLSKLLNICVNLTVSPATKIGVGGRCIFTV